MHNERTLPQFCPLHDICLKWRKIVSASLLVNLPMQAQWATGTGFSVQFWPTIDRRRSLLRLLFLTCWVDRHKMVTNVAEVVHKRSHDTNAHKRHKQCERSLAPTFAKISLCSLDRAMYWSGSNGNTLRTWSGRSLTCTTWRARVRVVDETIYTHKKVLGVRTSKWRQDLRIT